MLHHSLATILCFSDSHTTCLHNFISSSITVPLFAIFPHLGYADSFLMTTLSVVEFSCNYHDFHNYKVQHVTSKVIKRSFTYFNISFHVLHNLHLTYYNFLQNISYPSTSHNSAMLRFKCFESPLSISRKIVGSLLLYIPSQGIKKS